VPDFITGLIRAYDQAFRAKARLPMSLKQRRVYEALCGLYRELQRRPTFQEVADRMGKKSRGSTYTMINLLVRKGWVWIDSNGNFIPVDIAHPEIES
jgi:SOS-response transcriptional repressor LexA